MGRQFRGFKWAGKNKWTEAEGKKFPSRREALRYQVLRAMERAGHISMLRVHQRFSLNVYSESLGETVHVCDYISDATYLDDHGRFVVEDSKPRTMVTIEFQIKQKLMLALYGIRIKLV